LLRPLVVVHLVSGNICWTFFLSSFNLFLLADQKKRNDLRGSERSIEIENAFWQPNANKTFWHFMATGTSGT
jgi:hypothetical protein